MNANNDDKILVIGAGIGGLTLARALSRAGLACEIYERAPELRPLGAGIIIHTAAMLALRHIGLDGAVAAAGESLRVGGIASPSGRMLERTPLSFLEDEVGVPTVAIHRARLQAVLREGVQDVPLHMGAALNRYDGDATGVTATFANGTRARGKLLVGADGLRSTVRRQLRGDEPLRYAGYTSWRGIARPEQPIAPHEVREMWGRGARFGFAGIGHGETYWFAVLDAKAGETDPDPLGTVKRHFGDFGAPVPALLAATAAGDVLRTDIFDRPPISRWTSDNVTLLGDAAHPTTPNLGQGGCMAIEDALVLSHTLAHASSFATALATYEKARVARTAAIVKASFRFGKVAQLRSPAAVWLRDALVRLTPQATMRRQLLRSARLTLPSADD